MALQHLMALVNDVVAGLVKELDVYTISCSRVIPTPYVTRVIQRDEVASTRAYRDELDIGALLRRMLMVQKPVSCISSRGGSLLVDWTRRCQGER